MKKFLIAAFVVALVAADASAGCGRRGRGKLLGRRQAQYANTYYTSSCQPVNSQYQYTATYYQASQVTTYTTPQQYVYPSTQYQGEPPATSNPYIEQYKRYWEDQGRTNPPNVSDLPDPSVLPKAKGGPTPNENRPVRRPR